MKNYAKGEENGRAILYENDIPIIRKKNAEGVGYKKLAKMFNVHYTTIQKIINGKTWRHI